ncbi:MAG: discoidin domain-containing protein [Polyangiaceae bacterium]|nr:discoidin domain-containing protein [Polyangiaceae bacterium]
MPTSRTIQTTIRFATNSVTVQTLGRITTVSLLGGVIAEAVGDPALPRQVVYIALPPGSSNLTVNVKYTHRVRLMDGVHLSAVQPEMPTVLGAQFKWTPPDETHYAKRTEWPAEPYRLRAVSRLGDFAVAEVEVCPFRFHPASRELNLYTEAEVSISFTEDAPKKRKAPSIAALRYEERLAERLRGVVANKLDVKDHYVFDHTVIPKDLKTFPDVSHVIITSANLTTEVARLASWRSTLGLASRVVQVEDIAAGTVPDTGGAQFWQTSGFFDGGTRDLAEAVRAFIKWAAVNWSTEYVVLAGDVDQVPHRLAIHHQWSTASYGNLTLPDLHNPDLNSPRRFAASASTQKAGHAASAVADDDTTTSWECEANDANAWIRIDLFARSPINRVDLTWGASHPGSYSLEGSVDGTTWNVLYSTSSAPGGVEEIAIVPTSPRFLRLVIQGTTSFSLQTVKVFGVRRPKYSGAAYSMGATVTRIYLSRTMTPAAGDVLLVGDGPNKGTIIPYNPACSATQLGYRFVTDLLDLPGTPSATSTDYLEVQGPAAFHGQPLVLKTDLNYIPTDLYFSDVAATEYPPTTHHDWDADDNSVYGERYGGELDRVNSFADVHVGRLPLSTPEEAAVVVDKIIRYESYNRLNALGADEPLPADFAVNVVLGSQNFNDPDPNYLDTSAQGNENVRKMLIAVDPTRYTFHRLYQDSANVPVADQDANLEVADTTKIETAIQDGAGFVGLSSHGSPGYLCYLWRANVSALTNIPSIWYGNACSTNYFDDATTDCLGETALLNPNGGAVAYMGNTRWGSTGDNPVEFAFWSEAVASGRLGLMLDAARRAAGDWTRYTMNLLGDPAMRVWSNTPKVLTVTHPSKVDVGSSIVHLVVTSAGAPVQGASVCLTMPGIDPVQGLTNASGEVNVLIATVSPGTLRVAVSGTNLVPYHGTIAVKWKMCTAHIPMCPPLVVECPPRIITCPPRIEPCPPAIKPCPPAIKPCPPAIKPCPPLIKPCPPAIKPCPPAILPCPPHIPDCRGPIGGCTPAIIDCRNQIGGGCMRLAPHEFELPRELSTLFGISDVVDFARQLHTPEVESILNRLPPELARPLRMMGERIRREEKLDG